MSRVNAFPSSRLRRIEFEKFKADLELLLAVFTSQMLAKWMAKDKGNFSKRINGARPVTAEFLRDFYSSLELVIARVRQGASRYQIEQEMAIRPKEEADSLIKLRVELFELKGGVGQLKVILDEQARAIGEQALEIQRHSTKINIQEVAIKRLEEAGFAQKLRQKQPPK